MLLLQSLRIVTCIDTMTRMIAARYTSCFARKRPLILWRTFSSTGTKYMCFNISSVFPLCLGSAVISAHAHICVLLLFDLFKKCGAKKTKMVQCVHVLVGIIGRYQSGFQNESTKQLHLLPK